MLKLCQTFHCPPSQIDREDADIIRLMNIVARGTKAGEEE